MWVCCLQPLPLLGFLGDRCTCEWWSLSCQCHLCQRLRGTTIQCTLCTIPRGRTYIVLPIMVLGCWGTIRTSNCTYPFWCLGRHGLRFRNRLGFCRLGCYQMLGQFYHFCHRGSIPGEFFFLQLVLRRPAGVPRLQVFRFLFRNRRLDRIRRFRRILPGSHLWPFSAGASSTCDLRCNRMRNILTIRRLDPCRSIKTLWCLLRRHFLWFHWELRNFTHWNRIPGFIPGTVG